MLISLYPSQVLLMALPSMAEDQFAFASAREELVGQFGNVQLACSAPPYTGGSSGMRDMRVLSTSDYHSCIR